MKWRIISGGEKKWRQPAMAALRAATSARSASALQTALAASGDGRSALALVKRRRRFRMAAAV
jgi:ABC-type branched-subunit amino acid transport system substrate-binding protein